MRRSRRDRGRLSKPGLRRKHLGVGIKPGQPGCFDMKRTRLKRDTPKSRSFVDGTRKTPDKGQPKKNRSIADMDRSNFGRDMRKKAKGFLGMKRKALRKRGLRYAGHRKECFGDKAEWVRTIPCLVCGNTPCDPHHEPSVSRGGKAEDLTPLCRFHHGQRHSLGSARRFKIVHGIDLVAEAKRIEAEWREAA